MSAKYRRGDQLRALWKLVSVLDTPRTVEEICQETGLHIRRVYRWLDAGVEEGVVTIKRPRKVLDIP